MYIFREIFQVLERAKKIPDVRTRVNRKESESRLKGRSKGQRKVAGRQVEFIFNKLSWFLILCTLR